MRCVATQGHPLERGRRQGQACGDLARRWMDRTLDDLAGRQGCASVAAAYLETEKSFRRIIGYRDLWALKAVLDEDAISKEVMVA